MLTDRELTLSLLDRRMELAGISINCTPNNQYMHVSTNDDIDRLGAMFGILNAYEQLVEEGFKVIKFTARNTGKTIIVSVEHVPVLMQTFNAYFE